MVTKIYQFHIVPPFCQFYKKVVLRLSEHGDVIETQTIRIAPHLFLSTHAIKRQEKILNGNQERL